MEKRINHSESEAPNKKQKRNEMDIQSREGKQYGIVKGVPGSVKEKPTAINNVLQCITICEDMMKIWRTFKERAVYNVLDHYTMKAKEAKFPTFPLTSSVTIDHEYLRNGIKKWTAERIEKRSQPGKDELPHFTKVIQVG